MSDLISRKEAIDALHALQTYKLGVGDDLLLISQAEAQTELMMLSPQSEPKTGKWIRVDEKPYFRKHFHKVCCSNCNEEGYKKWNYCPNCGTKMGKVSEHE